MEYLLSFTKALGMFVVGLTAFRIMGSQAVGRLTDFDLVVAIAIGALIAKPLSDPELNPLISVVAISALVIAQLVLSVLSMKSSLFEKIVQGSPIKLIENGTIILSGLRKARISKNELMEELRIAGYSSASEVKKAYLEPSGKFSVFEKDVMK
ncbi:hypothetical protein BKP45_13505 [Anaerobacillus alkalidiazotrophicus]|uniref:YetF C-terminal domain-containing protein n=1 Tax=Anaerobacillus alkalidiazotrophicus TaxID=472963 RepID=A0A1S2M720_9BACI|nr:YetF domain-containing protein [Anaerobacillus alkalidiazotrophicus]OIJ19455.1 hypothetical protein BKP45_13505 [Anaerobacillus alkalidiazotrophicus]